jgi:hypothetical protein
LSLLLLLLFASCSDPTSKNTENPQGTVENLIKATEEPSPKTPSIREPELPAGETEEAMAESPTESVQQITVEVVTPDPTVTPILTSEDMIAPTEEPQAGRSLDEIDIARSEIEANVVEIRGLEIMDPFVVEQLTRTELHQIIRDEWLAEYSAEVARNDAITMSAFDFLAIEFDLFGFYLDLLTEEVLGYYDTEQNAFFLIDEDDDYDVLERLTHAHEAVHALQDQHYDLDRLDEDTVDSEASLALLALAEGDATLVQSLYLISGYMDPDELLEILTASMDIETPVLDSAPPILARELLFPYLDGVAFAEALYARGGFEAIDQAWLNPPQSTEHILHPERYLNGDAPKVISLAPLTDTLGHGWKSIDEDTVGELYLREYLAQQLDGGSVELASTGWGGDRYAVYWNEGEEALVMLLRLTWDSAEDSEEFLNLYQGYPAGLYQAKSMKQSDGGLCWQGDDVICLYDSGGDVIIARAPNLDIAALIAAEQLAMMNLEET